MKNFAYFLLSLSLAYIGSRLAFWVYDSYWTINYKVWKSEILPMMGSTIFLIAARVLLIFLAGKTLSLRYGFQSCDLFLLSNEFKLTARWTASALLVAFVWAISFTVFLDLVTIIGLVFMTTM